MDYLFDVIAFVNEDEVNPNFRPSEAILIEIALSPPLGYRIDR